MANIKSAIKRAELNKVANERNAQQKSAMRTLIKKFEAAPTEELYRAASSSIQKALSMLTKHHVIKHVLLLNLAN